MKKLFTQILFISIAILFSINTYAQTGLTEYGENISTSTNFVNKNGTIGSSPALSKNGQVVIISCISNTWAAKTNFGGTGRFYAVGFSIGTKEYIGTGYDGIAPRKKDFWEYDPATNAWTQKVDFGGEARSLAVGFPIGTKGYIGTGSNGSGTPLTDFWEYDPATNGWTRKTDFPGTPIIAAVGFPIGNKGYIGTGADGGSNPLKDFWEYDPAGNSGVGSWTAKTAFGGSGRYSAVGFSIGTKGYIGTGYKTGYLKDFWEYDQATDIWVQKADFGGTARRDAIGFSISTKGYIGTGKTDGGFMNPPLLVQDFWEYDQAADTWASKTAFGGTARYSAVGFSIGSKGYVGTGFDNSGFTQDFWEWCQ